MPVLPVLGVLFIALKLMGYIAWSWVWVLMPFWVIPIIVVLVWGGFTIGLSWLVNSKRK